MRSGSNLLNFDLINKKFVSNRAQLIKIVEQHKKKGEKVVLTNGAFDILHPGHVGYLSQAKKMGEILIIGLNTDESIKAYKDPKRPINEFKNRAAMLCALESVDYVTPLAEERPAELIRAVKPNIYIKGGDYKKEKLRSTPIVESLGGKVIIIPFVGNYSTTSLIDKIKAL
ncbi:MAG: Bifunctional protein HldE [Candidatus Roizmanbacteria bacterium GW2011_GWA2_36_23]|uniref:D-glycero-beta-D-manno-heptose 1-phosphate adenylyltransferase n=1 Tax=Candidatus Roizmanbacteria bacterium GW2011_GWA2_36_23 TaxID=1618480 RepID=A0A0G0GPM5_9BACT|nr:MAG: Bifunctional protein HldE [Candidatus Roizmanbacteria bacterium GW2011_GWA2_36_23]